MRARFQLTAEDIQRAVAEYIGSVRKVNVTAADVKLDFEERSSDPLIITVVAHVEVQDRR